MKSKAIYTCMTGNIDASAFHDPLVIEKDTEYFCYTDNPEQFKSEVFTPIKVSKKVGDWLAQSRHSRYYRLCGHKLPELQGFDLVLYADSNIQIIEPLQCLFDEIGDYPIAMTSHGRGGLAAEIEACKFLKKDFPHVLDKQLRQYLSEGYPIESASLWCCGVVLMNNKDTRLHECNELWYEQVLKYSVRTQVSFAYVQWKLQLPVRNVRCFKYNWRPSTFTALFKRHVHDRKQVVM